MSTITMGDRMSQLKADMQGMLTEADKAGGMDQPTFDAFMALKGQFEDLQTQKSNATKALDFLSVAKVGQWLQVEPTIVKRGRSLCFASALVTADGKPCARASATFQVVS